MRFCRLILRFERGVIVGVPSTAYLIHLSVQEIYKYIYILSKFLRRHNAEHKCPYTGHIQTTA